MCNCISTDRLIRLPCTDKSLSVVVVVVGVVREKIYDYYVTVEEVRLDLCVAAALELCGR